MTSPNPEPAHLDAGVLKRLSFIVKSMERTEGETHSDLSWDSMVGEWARRLEQIIAPLREVARPEPQPAEGEAWRCFHCDEVFTDRACAELHFGKLSICDEPICTVGAEKYRELERTVASFISESDPSSRAFYEMGARHASELRREEEKGYERGLRDARHEEIWRHILSARSPSDAGGV